MFSQKTKNKSNQTALDALKFGHLKLIFKVILSVLNISTNSTWVQSRRYPYFLGFALLDAGSIWYPK
jgi:hypothetical protein